MDGAQVQGRDTLRYGATSNILDTSNVQEVIPIGAAFETFLSMLFIVLLVIGAIAFATKPFWGRIARYFKNWIEHDRLLEEQQRAERECRKKAQVEIEEYCHDDILQGKANVSAPCEPDITERTEEKTEQKTGVPRTNRTDAEVETRMNVRY